MFEHVGTRFHDAFFRQCRELLSDDGVMLLHFIGNSDVPDFNNPWIERYIFPGGHIPSLSEAPGSVVAPGGDSRPRRAWLRRAQSRPWSTTSWRARPSTWS